MGCFLPHKRQPIVDFYKSYTASEIAFVNIGINPNWCAASWDCRFALCELDKTTIILDTETYNCVKITSPGYSQHCPDLYFDGTYVFVAGQTSRYSSRWRGQMLKFDTDLNLLLRKVFGTSVGLFFNRVVKKDNLLYFGGIATTSTGVICKSDLDFNILENFTWGQKNLRVGIVGNDIVAGYDSGHVVCLDNTESPIDFNDGRSSNNIYATRNRFFADKTNYYDIALCNTSIARGWHFSPTWKHACCGGYVVKLDPANDFAVVKALYTPDYDLFGCTDTKFVGKFKPTGNIAIIDVSQGIDSLALLESFTETSVTVTKQNFSWSSTSFGIRGIYESSDPITITDGNCVEVTS